MPEVQNAELLPREPSHEMIEAGLKAYEPMPTTLAPEVVVKVIYQAMFDAEHKRLLGAQ